MQSRATRLAINSNSLITITNLLRYSNGDDVDLVTLAVEFLSGSHQRHML